MDQPSVKANSNTIAPRTVRMMNPTALKTGKAGRQIVVRPLF
jgi:hypothetical protein